MPQPCVTMPRDPPRQFLASLRLGVSPKRSADDAVEAVMQRRCAPRYSLPLAHFLCGERALGEHARSSTNLTRHSGKIVSIRGSLRLTPNTKASRPLRSRRQDAKIH